MRIYIANATKESSKETFEFVKWVCEQVISKQSVKKAKRGEYLIPFDVDIVIRPVNRVR